MTWTARRSCSRWEPIEQGDSGDVEERTRKPLATDPRVVASMLQGAMVGVSRQDAGVRVLRKSKSKRCGRSWSCWRARISKRAARCGRPFGATLHATFHAGMAGLMRMLLRPAEPADAMAVARVHVRSWQAAYRGLLPDAYLDGLRPEDRAARYDFATEDVRAAGDDGCDRRWRDLRVCYDVTGARLRMCRSMASCARSMSIRSGGDAVWARR